MQRDIEIQPFLDNGNERVDADSDPDLRFDRILGSADEMLDAKTLLDQLEKQLDLPAPFSGTKRCSRVTTIDTGQWS
jgi:hypothetical protein